MGLGRESEGMNRPQGLGSWVQSLGLEIVHGVLLHVERCIHFIVHVPESVAKGSLSRELGA